MLPLLARWKPLLDPSLSFSSFPFLTLLSFLSRLARSLPIAAPIAFSPSLFRHTCLLESLRCWFFVGVMAPFRMGLFSFRIWLRWVWWWLACSWVSVDVLGACDCRSGRLLLGVWRRCSWAVLGQFRFGLSLLVFCFNKLPMAFDLCVLLVDVFGRFSKHHN